MPRHQHAEQRGQRYGAGASRKGKARLRAAKVQMGEACDVLPRDAPGDALEIDHRGLLGEIEAETQGNTRGAWRRLEAEQGQRRARILAHDRAFAGKREPVRLQRALPDKGDLDRRRLERSLAGDLGIRHAGELDDEPALAPGGGGNALEWKIG